MLRARVKGLAEHRTDRAYFNGYICVSWSLHLAHLFAYTQPFLFGIGYIISLVQ